MYRIMFVCTGNICRSPLAHGVFENLIREQSLESVLTVESSGTDAWHVGEPMDSRMQQTATHHGLEFHHRSRQLVATDFREYDALLTMDRNNYRSAMALAGNANGRNRVKMFRDYDPDGPGDVPDPWYGGKEGFEVVWVIVQRTCQVLLEDIKTNGQSFGGASR